MRTKKERYRGDRKILLKLANQIARERHLRQNPKIEDVVFAVTRQRMPQIACWNWLLAERNRRVRIGKPVEIGASEAVKVPAPKAPSGAPSPQPAIPSARLAWILSPAFYVSDEWRALRYTVLRASNGCCCLCGRSRRLHGVVLHVDHIKPRSRFPELALSRANLQVLCEDCNLGKGNRDDRDWRAPNEEDDKIIALDAVD